MDINLAFPSRYVKASDLQGNEVPVVISEAKYEEVGTQGEKKLVLYFQGRKKALICNRTNANRIAWMHGPETDDWVGREIVLTPDLVEFRGQTVEAIRIKPGPKYGTPRQSQPRPHPQQQPGPQPMQNPSSDGFAKPAAPRNNTPGGKVDEQLDDSIPF